MNKAIQDISEIRFGLYTQPENSGEVAYLQVRQFNDQGRLTSKANDFINITNKTETHLLKDGDVLFVGKGNRLFSWCYRNIEGPAIASSIFFVLRPNPQVVYPEYLAAFLNAPQAKSAFQQLGSGTNIFSIRKSELGAFQLPILPMQQQKRIAALADLHQKEIDLAQQLILQKQNLYTAIISKLIK
ncbi:MAG: restriction endonuclease subunit S [Ferruginibacter sp.]|nr:restriction endonuclease subunit S [Ferruginibacter sp.]